MLWEVARAYPWAFLFAVVLPFVGALGVIVGAFSGYENLRHQLQSDRQADRIESTVTAIHSDQTALDSTLSLLKSYDAKLQGYGKKDELLSAVIAQYQRLSQAAALFAARQNRDAGPDQGKIASQILEILNQDAIHAVARIDLPGSPLIINLGSNSFRVIFSVPMRITPRLTFTGLPAGTTPSVSSASEIGFSVTFFPLSTTISTFGLIADAEL
jgi:hypothetical protein